MSRWCLRSVVTVGLLLLLGDGAALGQAQRVRVDVRPVCIRADRVKTEDIKLQIRFREALRIVDWRIKVIPSTEILMKAPRFLVEEQEGKVARIRIDKCDLPIGKLGLELTPESGTPRIYHSDLYIVGKVMLKVFNLTDGSPALRVQVPGLPGDRIKVVRIRQDAELEVTPEPRGEYVVVPIPPSFQVGLIDVTIVGPAGYTDHGSSELTPGKDPVAPVKEPVPETKPPDVTDPEVKPDPPKPPEKTGGTAGQLNRILDRDGWGHIEAAGQRYDLVCVPRLLAYPLGLTKKQKNVPFLAQGGFAENSYVVGSPLSLPLLHSFLVMRTEVTNAQFWTFVLDQGKRLKEVPESLSHVARTVRELPAGIADKPVRGLSCADALAFAGWLKRKLGRKAALWTVRLPHEVEWEMAARADVREYVFPDSDIHSSVKKLAAEDYRDVGTNAVDRSWLKVCDLSSNVREWTCTVYQRDLLAKLLFGRDEIQGWDPRDPDRLGEVLLPPGAARGKSQRVTVRGGEIRDQALHMQVSVRRFLEMNMRDDGVGFRLVLIRD